MISESLNYLLNLSQSKGKLVPALVLGMLPAVAIPVNAVLLGEIVQLLIIPSQAAEASNAVTGSAISKRLPDVVAWLPDMSRLGHISCLLVMAFVVVVFAASMLFAFYRRLQNTAVEFEVSIIQHLREHAQKLGTERTLSAQRTELVDCLDYHLPRVRSTLTRWWQIYPLHAVQLAMSVIVAGLIQIQVTLLTLVAVVLGILVFRFVESRRRSVLPVVRQRATQQREILSELSINGPLLETVHSPISVENRFQEQLQQYRKDAFTSLTNSVWKLPLLSVVSSLCAVLFIFVIAVQVLLSEGGFTVASAFAFVLCLGGATTSFLRLQRGRLELKHIEAAAEKLKQFLTIRIDDGKSSDLVVVNKVSEGIVLEHATVQDSTGLKLLENVSFTFSPGRLIGVVSSQQLQARALVDLVMGYGRPSSGRMLVDGTVSTDIDPSSLASCAHWVAGDGAIVTGSIEANVCGGVSATGDLPAINREEFEQALKDSRFSEALLKLSNGPATVITPGDDRLQGDDAFRLAMARAILRASSVTVIEEPGSRGDANEEERTLAGLGQLVNHDRITVVLPRRLATLRRCDQLVVLHESTVVGTGTHGELVQNNDLYRHLNYLKFNPYKSVSSV